MRVIEVRGGLSIDHLVTVGEVPQWFEVGGPGFYGALGARVAGTFLESRGHEPREVALNATVPAQAVPLLESAGVNLQKSTLGEVPTLWILNSPQGRRIISTSAPAGTHELDESGVDATVEDAETKAACLTPRDPIPSEADVLLRCAPRTPMVKSSGQIVCVDPDQNGIAELGWDYFDMLSEGTSVFLPSRVQLRQLGDKPEWVAHELRARTGRSVVARLDKDGTLVLPARGGMWAVSAPSVEVVDTTGAGDSHGGAFAAAITSSDNPQALIGAAVVASAVVANTLKGPGALELIESSVTEQQLRAIRVDEREL